MGWPRRGLNRAEIWPETPAPTLFLNRVANPDSCVSFVPTSSPQRLLELGRFWGAGRGAGEPGKLLTNELVFKGSKKSYNS